MVGELGRAVGLRGEIDVRIVSDDPQRFVAGSVVLVAESLRPLTVRSLRTHRDRAIVAFEEVTDRVGAQALRGVALVVAAEGVRDLDEGEFWDHDLIGCEVATTDGSSVGPVTDVLHSAANDVLVVDTRAGERLVPLLDHVVRSVDTSGKRIVIDPLPGLLD